MTRAIAVFLLCLVLAPAAAAGEHDSGTSQNLLMRYKLDDNWFFSSINNFATRGGGGEFAIGYVDLTFGRELGGGFSVDAGYRRAWINIGGSRDEHRPLLNLKWRGQVDDWFLLARARLEFRTFPAQFLDNRLRFRNHLLAVSPWRPGPLPARWFIEHEGFYEFNGNGYNMNWLTTGFRVPLADGVTLKLGYRWQSMRRGGDWRHRHVLVSGLNLFF